MIQHSLNAGTVRTLLCTNCKLNRLDNSALDVFRELVILTVDSHRPHRQRHIRRDTLEIARQQISFFHRHPRGKHSRDFATAVLSRFHQGSPRGTQNRIIV